MIDDKLKARAVRGDADSQFRLGMMLTSVAACTDDREEKKALFSDAVSWLGLAAKQGHADAQHTLGSYCMQSDDIAKAIWFYKQAAEQGHAKAQYDLGVCYVTGTGLERNVVTAVRWFRRAAESGYVSAEKCYRIALWYYQGTALSKNMEEAVYWLKLGADHGDAKAQYFLGNCFANEDGTQKSMNSAIHWWTEAANQGNLDAQQNLSICYEKGIGVKQDHQRAYYWREKGKTSQ